MKSLLRALFLAGCTTLVPLAAGGATEIRSTLADQQQLAVTIYNQDLALVRDVRRALLPTGDIRLALRDVAAKIRPETALLRSLSAPAGLRTLEQNFDFDLLTPAALLQKYVGRQVRLVVTHPTTGAETIKTAEVLSAAEGGVVLRIGDRIETGIPGRLIYDEVPANLRDRPTLSVQLANQTADGQELEISYLTGGLSWKADYVATLNDADNRLALNGWVTLTNQSGTSFPNAKLQLVAGDLHRVHDVRRKHDVLQRLAAAPVADAVHMEREQLFEYHLYKLPRPTTLAENQTKQVALLSAPTVTVRKELLLQGSDYYYRSHVGELGQKMKVAVYIELANRRADGLGQPLPAGIVRVYKNDRAGQAVFVGEDRIDHTPENEKLRLKLGDAFDVTANKTQTDYKSLGRSYRYAHSSESAYRLVLKNAKQEPVTVRVQEPIPGDWEMLAESQPHVKKAAHPAVWDVPVPANGEAELTYRVRSRW